MKTVKVLILMMVLSFFSVNEGFAQHKIESNRSSQQKVGSSKSSQQTKGNLKVEERTWNSQIEQALNKKKGQPAQNVVREDKKNEQNVVREDKVVEQPEVEIKNTCFDKISVDLVSLQGNRASQEVTITISFTNHEINKNVYIRNFDAYNEEGDHFSLYNIGSFSTLTDITQKTSWKVGQMLPSKNSKLTAISFRIDDCTIEMRNLPIDWR